jgi:pSer/pThr/pTyr-binding forkhead associated (FHA) protein
VTDLAAPLAQLRVVEGPDTGTRYELRADVVLGRDDEAAGIVLADTTGAVSRRHARVAFRDGAAWLEDLGSTN